MEAQVWVTGQEENIQPTSKKQKIEEYEEIDSSEEEDEIEEEDDSDKEDSWKKPVVKGIFISIICFSTSLN
jgi:hypothetical protein